MTTKHETVRVIDCREQEHGSAILQILNEAIVNSTALYDYAPRPPQVMNTWFSTKRAADFPVIGVVNEAGRLLAFASWGTFRAFPAYKYSVEHSVYVHHEARGQGLGELLMRALIERARQKQMHVLVGCIDATNGASIRLHERLGFQHAGTMRQIGFKLGRWLDAAFYQLNLDTPLLPQDG
jgi:phosphinothricin acetyltransferase